MIQSSDIIKDLKQDVATARCFLRHQAGQPPTTVGTQTSRSLLVERFFIPPHELEEFGLRRIMRLKAFDFRTAASVGFSCSSDLERAFPPCIFSWPENLISALEITFTAFISLDYEGRTRLFLLLD